MTDLTTASFSPDSTDSGQWRNASRSDANLTPTADPGADDVISLDAEFTLRLVYAAVGSVGVVGNAVVIGVIARSRRMRRAPTNVLIANQSAIDLSASMFILLCTFIRDVDRVDGWLAKEMFCRLWADNFPIWGLFVSSTYNLVCITVERYSAIVRPMRHARTCGRARIRTAVALAWFVGLAYNLAYMVPTSPYKDGDCTAYSEWPSLGVQRAVGLLTIALQFFLPIVVITFAYSRIVVCLRRGLVPSAGGRHAPPNAPPSARSDDPTDVKREQRMKRARTNVIKTLVMVAASFVLCWSPNQIIYTMYNVGYQVDFNGAFYHFTVIAVFLNCCINPFIYAFQYDQFKNELLKSCRKEQLDVSELSAASDNSVRTSDTSTSQISRRTVYTVPSAD